ARGSRRHRSATGAAADPAEPALALLHLELVAPLVFLACLGPAVRLRLAPLLQRSVDRGVHLLQRRLDLLVRRLLAGRRDEARLAERRRLALHGRRDHRRRRAARPLALLLRVT